MTTTATPPRKPRPIPAVPLARRLLDALASDRSWAAPAELARRIGAPPRGVRDKLWTLYRAGAVEREGAPLAYRYRYRYRLAAEGAVPSAGPANGGRRARPGAVTFATKLAEGDRAELLRRAPLIREEWKPAEWQKQPGAPKEWSVPLGRGRIDGIVGPMQ